MNNELEIILESILEKVKKRKCIFKYKSKENINI